MKITKRKEREEKRKKRGGEREKRREKEDVYLICSFFDVWVRQGGNRHPSSMNLDPI